MKKSSSLINVSVPIVLETWAKETKNIEFYSETADDSIPTIDLGIPNTERGEWLKVVGLPDFIDDHCLIANKCRLQYICSNIRTIK